MYHRFQLNYMAVYLLKLRCGWGFRTKLYSLFSMYTDSTYPHNTSDVLLSVDPGIKRFLKFANNKTRHDLSECKACYN